jgi:polyisoprenoid-binding protein YceI
MAQPGYETLMHPVPLFNSLSIPSTTINTMKKLILILAFALPVVGAVAQKLTTRDANIYFNPNKNQSNKEYSALSKEGTAVLNAPTAEVAFLVPMKTFHFNNALLEEHFNENYLHTNKFPNGTYKGKLTGFDPSMLTKDGEYKFSSEGEVALHGVKKAFKAPVTLTVQGKTATFKCAFQVKAEDYNIEIPDLVKPKLMESTPLTATIVFKM